MNNKWISVKERLPDYDGPYLVYIEKKQECGTVLNFCEIIHNHFNKWVVGKLEYKVTHWQPLPLPPTGEPNSISNESIGEDELADKFRYALLHDFGNLIVTPCVRNCTKIALQYHQSKLEELEKWINEQEKKAETNDYFIYAPDLMDKIKSL